MYVRAEFKYYKNHSCSVTRSLSNNAKLNGIPISDGDVFVEVAGVYDVMPGGGYADRQPVAARTRRETHAGEQRR